MEELEKLLTNAFQLTATEWDLIQKRLTFRTLQKGEFLIEQTRICKYAGFITKGVMRYFTYDAEGNDPTCYFVSENHFFTDPYVFWKRTPSGINLQAVTKCEVWTMSYESDQALQAELPRWSDITKQLLLEVTLDFSNQKALLTLNATQRYEYFVENYPLIAQRVPLQYVATYLGIKQPSLSRVRRNG